MNIIASTNGYSDIVIGNVVGSNNFNLFIILGISGLIMPITVQSSTAWKEIPTALFVTILLLLFINDFIFSEGTYLSRFDSLIMLTLFVLFSYYVFRQMKSDSSIETDVVADTQNIISVYGGVRLTEIFYRLSLFLCVLEESVSFFVELRYYL